MEYAYAALLLNEAGEELNEEHLTAVLEAAGCGPEESRVKALVAALEDADVSALDAARRADDVTVEGDDADLTPETTREDGNDPADGDRKPADESSASEE